MEILEKKIATNNLRAIKKHLKLAFKNLKKGNINAYNWNIENIKLKSNNLEKL